MQPPRPKNNKTNPATTTNPTTESETNAVDPPIWQRLGATASPIRQRLATYNRRTRDSLLQPLREYPNAKPYQVIAANIMKISGRYGALFAATGIAADCTNISLHHLYNLYPPMLPYVSPLVSTLSMTARISYLAMSLSTVVTMASFLTLLPLYLMT
jgi:hypothetical protein